MIGLCLADPHPSEVNDGSDRTQAAIHFACRYRLGDFMLSNMVNSGIYTICVVLNSRFQSIISHVKSGIDWDLSRKNGGVLFFPPYLTDHMLPYGTARDDVLQRSLDKIAELSSETVVVTDCACPVNIDYRKAEAELNRTGADAVAICVRKQIPRISIKYSIAASADSSGRVTKLSHTSPSDIEERDVLINAFVMKKSTLLRIASSEKNFDMREFALIILGGKLQSLDVRIFRHDGYSAEIYSLDTFFHYNMEMLKKENRDALFKFEDRTIFTSVKDSLPPIYGPNARVSNSLIADGCVLEGTVENCILFRNVTIKPGAVVRNSILQTGVTVEKNGVLEYVFADSEAIITTGKRLSGTDTHSVYIPEGKLI